MSSNNSNSGNNRNGYSFPDFSLRRLLLQTRAGRSPYSNRMCDVERGSGSGGSKSEKSSFGTTSSASSHRNDSSAQHSGTGTSSSSSATTTQPSTHQYVGNQRGLAARSGGLLSFSGGASSSASGYGSTNNNNNNHNRGSNCSSQQQECPLCYGTESQGFYTMLNCKHFACRSCLESYLTIEIFESRTEIACPQCTEAMHPSDIEVLLQHFPTVMKKYEDFMVRRVLLSDPDSRWCPAPDCSYAVIATGCASCPRIKCERPGCDVNFCYHCKAEWHPDQTCDAARALRSSGTPMRATSGSISLDSQHRGDDIKPCPRCQVLIVKMDDGSCNHMVCAVCGSEFCWLCMKEISDLHYLSPSGCTFWGKKPWSRKKKLLWQLGTLVGAPVGIALVAGIAVPAMIIGIPVWIGRKLHTRYRLSGKHKRNCAVLGGVAASVLVSPVLAGLAVAIGVPILLFYVYGVVPVSLCRAGCAVSTTRDGFKFDFDEEDNSSRNQDASSVDAISRIGATSIGEVSLSVASGSHIGVSSQNNAFMLGHSAARGESTTALSGSITGNKMEVQADVSASETASAVTCVSEKSGNTLNDTASTRALAGSMYKQHMDSSNISEDGASERVRFDNTVFYVMDNKKEFSDKDANSLYSDDPDTTSLSSIQKRSTFTQRMPTLNSSNNLSEMSEKELLNISDECTNIVPTSSLIPSSSSSALPSSSSSSSSSAAVPSSAPITKSALNSVPVTSELLTSTSTSSQLKPNETMPAGPNVVSDTNFNSKPMSKAAVLRHLFFSQPTNGNNNNNNGNNCTSNTVVIGTNSPMVSTSNTVPTNFNTDIGGSK